MRSIFCSFCYVVSLCRILSCCLGLVSLPLVSDNLKSTTASPRGPWTSTNSSEVHQDLQTYDGRFESGTRRFSVEDENFRYGPSTSRTKERMYILGSKQESPSRWEGRRFGLSRETSSQDETTNMSHLPERSADHPRAETPKPVPVGEDGGRNIVDAPKRGCEDAATRRDAKGRCRKLVRK